MLVTSTNEAGPNSPHLAGPPALSASAAAVAAAGANQLLPPPLPVPAATATASPGKQKAKSKKQKQVTFEAANTDKAADGASARQKATADALGVADALRAVQETLVRAQGAAKALLRQGNLPPGEAQNMADLLGITAPDAPGEAEGPAETARMEGEEEEGDALRALDFVSAFNEPPLIALPQTPLDKTVRSNGAKCMSHALCAAATLTGGLPRTCALHTTGPTHRWRGFARRWSLPTCSTRPR